MVVDHFKEDGCNIRSWSVYTNVRTGFTSTPIGTWEIDESIADFRLSFMDMNVDKTEIIRL